MRFAISILTVVTLLAAAGARAQGPVAPNEVRLCEHENYQGKCVSFFLKPHMRHRLVPRLSVQFDDQVSSMQVGSDVTVYPFSHQDFIGDGKKNDGGPKLGPDLNDQISSLVITRHHYFIPKAGPRAISAVEGIQLLSCVWPDTDCDFEYHPLPENKQVKEVRIPTLGKHMDNRAQTVWISGYLTVELYPEPHFKGAQVILETFLYSGYMYSLPPWGIENNVSSMIFRSRSGQVEVGQTPPLLPPERGGEATGEPHRAPPVIQPMTAQPMDSPTEPGGRPDDGSLRVEGPEITSQPAQLTFEHGINRAGGDYKNFDLPEPRPELCRDACAADGACKAYTYVKPGIQGAKARCWLKSTAGPPRPDGCCVSGVKP